MLRQRGLIFSHETLREGCINSGVLFTEVRRQRAGVYESVDSDTSSGGQYTSMESRSVSSAVTAA